MSFTDIVEIQEVGRKAANKLLARGYRLLAVEQKTWMEVFKSDDPEMHQKKTPYVRKDLVYGIGRTAEQAPIVEAMADSTPN